MINDIIVLDDVIPKAYQDAIEKRVMTENFPWWYQSDSSYTDHIDAKRFPSFNHLLSKNGVEYNQSTSFFLPIAYHACEKINFKINGFIYIKSCLQMPIIMDTSDRSNNVHIDSQIPHLVVLYYINDSDGDTIIYDRMYDKSTENWIDITRLEHNKLPVKQTVTPKKGRVVLFDGRYLHNSSTPLHGPRCILNFDVV
jgi:hypothetical protein